MFTLIKVAHRNGEVEFEVEIDRVKALIETG